MPQETIIYLEVRVQKRNGQQVEYNPKRIVHAVANAFKEYYGQPREAELSDEQMKDALKVTDCVFALIKERALKNEVLTVEEIQDEVIRQLYENGFKEVGERYASYRKHHAARRTACEAHSVA